MAHTNNFTKTTAWSKAILTLLFAVLMASNAMAQLTGTYTIDATKSASSTNYTSFQDAVDDLLNGTRTSGTANGPGVKAAVKFNVAKGTYYESFEITAISGADATNTITFDGGDSSKTIINDTLNANNFVVYLNGGAFITFKNLTIQRSITDGNVIKLDNYADSNSFISNRLVGYPTTGYTNTAVVYAYSYSTGDSANRFINNTIENSCFAFYWYGGYSNRPIGNIIDHNIIYGQSYYGIYMWYMDRTQITNNKIIETNGYYPMLLGQIDATSDTSLIANNFISYTGGGTGYGVYVYMSDMFNFYNNNVYTDVSNSYSTAAYFYRYTAGTSVNVMNNIFVNTGGGFAITQYYNGYGFTNSDYNDFYWTGANMGQWNGSSQADLATWQSTSSMDANSMDVNPKFYSKTNLHVINVLLNGKGSVSTSVPKDIDGETRNATTPDIGADEFFPVANDVGATGVDSPAVGFCIGKRNVYVRITNFGTAVLTSANIDWWVNGTAQTSKSVSLSSNPLGIGKDTVIYVGNYNFSSASVKYVVKASANTPNGLTSGTPTANDSFTSIVNSGLSGTFTIDPSKAAGSGNYQTFTAAANDVTAKGICGAVVINVASGTYTEQVAFGFISGANASNTVTFQSSAKDSTKVILDFPATNSYSPTSDYTVQLKGSSHVTFRWMTIQRSGSGYYGNVLSINGGSHYNQFLNSILRNTVTGTKYNYIIYSSGDNDSFNTFAYNTIYGGGYYNIYWMGVSGVGEVGNVFKNNLIDTVQYYGALLFYQTRLQFLNNIVTGISYQYGAGIYCYNYNTPADGTRISGNKVIMSNGGYCMYSYYLSGSATDSVVISNNFFTSVGATAYGGMHYYSDYQAILHNNYYVDGTSSYGLYIYAFSTTSIHVLNNNIINPSNSNNTLYSPSSGSITITDYNNFGDATALSNVQALFSQDVNSFGVDPKFTSKTDLHVKNVTLDAAATPIGILKDIDGQTRSTTTPDIGADEFFPVANDAGIISIDSPASGFCGGKKDIYVRISNYGTNAISSVTVNWSVNGTTQAPVSVTMSSPTLGKGMDTLWKVGTLTFTTGSGKDIVAYTSNPNGTTDGDKSNDTGRRNINTGMSGSYTIGGTSPDFATFTAAATDLNNRGVCGAVVFNARNGTYNDQVLIKSIGGVSATNTITFQSQSGDSSKVNVNWPSGNSNNYSVLIENTNYVSFKKLTFMRTGNNSSARVIELRDANYCAISNCRLFAVKDNGFNQTNGVIYSGNSNDEYNTISNNRIWGGSYSVYWQGGNSSNMESGNIFDGNLYDSNGYYVNYIMYQDSFKFMRNTIKDLFYSGGGMGIYLQYVNDGSWISKNKIILKNGGYGIYGFYFQGNSTDSNFISNNMISIGSSGYYAMLLYYSDYTNMYYNSIVSYGPSYYYNIFLYHYTTVNSFMMYDNSIAALGGGYAFYFYSNYPTASDYNNLYTSGSTLGYGLSTSCPTLSDWQTASSMDATSISVDPMHASPTNLHSKSTALNNLGVSLNSIKDDIDGETRSTTTPDIGADEFTPPTHDLSATAVLLPNGVDCGDSNTTVAFRYHNFGVSGESGYKVSVNIVGAGSASTTSTSILVGSDTTDTIVGTKINTYAGGKYTVIGKVNLSTDQDLTNDSIVTTVDLIAHAAKPTVISGVSCSGTSTVKLIAHGSTGDSIMWWDSYKGGNLLAKGDTFTTPTITKTTTYYAQAYSAQDSLGLADHTILGSSYGLTYHAYDMIFDALNDMVIDSVTIYPQNTGVVQINITDASGKTVGTRSYNVTTLASSYDPTVIPVKIKIPKGKGYRMNPVGSTVGGIYYNYYGSGFPYSTYKNRLCKITGNSLGANYYWFFFFNWKVSNNLNCPSQRTPVVAVIGVGPKPAAAFNYTTGCAGKSAAFVDKSTIASGASLVAWAYDFGDGNTYSSTTSGTTTHVYTKAGTYKVILAVTSNKGCIDTISHMVVVDPKPTALFTATNVCEGSPTGFVDKSTAGSGTLTYAWDFGDGGTDTKSSPSHTYAKAGTYTATLIVTDAKCTDTSKMSVEVYANPKTAFGTKNACVGTMTQFVDSTTLASGKITSYAWSLGVTGATDTVANPTYTYSKIGSYTVTLTVTSDKGCSKGLTKTLTIDATPVAKIDTARVSGSKINFSSKNTAASYAWDFGD
ncbi:MAG: PKD domain-containing protein [Bacteroidetes bacterium]|nr:PKD domain-containing protein [Bacteroidota bacterium]